MSADKVADWDLLMTGFDLKRVNHSEAYSENGINTNLAESYFSRLRRMIRSQHHAVSVKYLGAYAVLPPGLRITAKTATVRRPIG